MIYEIYTENGAKKKRALTGNGYGLPLGSIIAVYSNLVPDGYLPCNGAVYDTTTYAALYAYLGSNRLPDLRECNLVGAGQSDNNYDASTNPNGIHEHDVYAVGEFKDDQMQRITGTIESTPDRGGTNIGDGALFTSFGSATWVPDGRQSGSNNGVRFDNAKVVRTGYDSSGTLVGTDTTHGKQVGVNYCIKATPAYVEPDTVSDMVNTLRTQDSYSTSEVNTGKKWIDGKKIYKKTFTNSWGSSGSSDTGIVHIDISTLNVDSVVKGEGVALGSNSSYGKGYYPMTFINTSSSDTGNAYKWFLNEAKTTLTFQLQGGGLSFKIFECSFTLEYTKTTD